MRMARRRQTPHGERVGIGGHVPAHPPHGLARTVWPWLDGTTHQVQRGHDGTDAPGHDVLPRLRRRRDPGECGGRPGRVRRLRGHPEHSDPRRRAPGGLRAHPTLTTEGCSSPGDRALCTTRIPEKCARHDSAPVLPRPRVARWVHAGDDDHQVWSDDPVVHPMRKAVQTRSTQVRITLRSASGTVDP